MKAAGATLIILACTWYGLIKASRLGARAKCLAAFLESLRFIQAELSSTAPPLPDLFSRLADTARPRVRGFYRQLSKSMEGIGEISFSQIWLQALESEGACLTDFQRSELMRPGAMLGRYDYQEQAAALQSCLARLEPELRKANRKAAEGLRLYTGLGLVGGIMAATVML